MMNGDRMPLSFTVPNDDDDDACRFGNFMMSILSIITISLFLSNLLMMPALELHHTMWEHSVNDREALLFPGGVVGNHCVSQSLYSG